MPRSGPRSENSIVRSMKSHGLTPPLVAATLFLILGAASGQSQEPRMSPDPARGARRDADLLKRYDKNGDGKLDDDERADAKEAMLTEQINQQMKSVTFTPGGAVGPPRPAADNSSLERVLRAAIEADPAQLRRFDRDQNGKMDDDEWRRARQEIMRAFAEDVVRPPNPESEAQRRIADLALRRAISLAAAGVVPAPVPAEEKRRLEAVSAEVARRRALRDKAAENGPPPGTMEDIQRRKDGAAAEIKRLDTLAAEIAERRKQRENIAAQASGARPSNEQAEQEAKLLVKDLLEIGMAQRKQFEARARAAEEKQPADTAAKK